MSGSKSWRPGVAEQSPDPNHLWIRYRIRKWPGAPRCWVDLGSGSLGQQKKDGGRVGRKWEGQILDDLLYLPPVPERQHQEREALAKSLTDQGIPVLVQRFPRDPGEAGVMAVYDLLETLLEGDLSELSNLPRGAVVIWPLIAGYTDSVDLCRSGLEILAAAGVSAVQGISIELDPTDSRRIVERGGEEGFETLFHGSAPSERAFSQLVSNTGLEPFVSRPVPLRPRWLRSNRQLSEVLYLCGELWLRLGRPEATGQELFAVARRVDMESHDVAAICREGNLRVMDWIDPLSRRVITEWASRARSSELEVLRADYLSKPGSAG
jgi:hypothetical protein